MKIVIDGITEEQVDGLCSRKWHRPNSVQEEQDVEVPDPDPEAEEGSTVFVKKMVTVPNPEPKIDFVKRYIISFVTNEYRLVVRTDKKAISEAEAEAKIEAEVSLS